MPALMSSSSNASTIEALRREARQLLNEFDAADALAGYYALHHPAQRSKLYVHRRADGVVDGFLSECQTGFDLLRPIVTFRARGLEALPALIELGLMPGRPYIVIFPRGLLERAEPHLQLSGVTVNRVLRLDPARITPEVNVLVTTKAAPDGLPRAEVRRDKAVIAAAGVNWRSPDFAEIYVSVQEEERMQGLGRAVANALVIALLKQRVTPLYMVPEDNVASYKLAEKVGFVDTGASEIMAQAVRAG